MHLERLVTFKVNKESMSWFDASQFLKKSLERLETIFKDWREQIFQDIFEGLEPILKH